MACVKPVVACVVTRGPCVFTVPAWTSHLPRALAREDGRWNLFLPALRDDEPGTRPSNLDCAPLAEAMGRPPWAAEVFNSYAPDSGNIELLHCFATPGQLQASPRLTA